MIHYISHFEQPWRTEYQVAEALRWHGYEVECYQVNRDSDRPGENGTPRVCPGDLVFTAVPQTFGEAELRRYKDAGAGLACWYFDWIREPTDRAVRYLPALRLMDAVFSTDGFDSSWYEDNGVSCREWLPQAAPQYCTVLPSLPGAPVHDVLFLGRLYNHDREEVVNRLRTKYDVGVYGATKTRFLWGRERMSLIRNAKVVVGMSLRSDVAGYWSNRVFLTLGCGGFFLCRKVPGLTQMFKPGTHLAMFDGDPAKAVGKWLARDKSRERIRQAGHNFVRENHTYIHRAGELIDRLRKRGLLK